MSSDILENTWYEAFRLHPHTKDSDTQKYELISRTLGIDPREIIQTILQWTTWENVDIIVENRTNRETGEVIWDRNWKNKQTF